jgi:integrase
MSPKRKREYGDGSVYKRGNIWWIAYRVNGQQKNESSGSRNKEDALHLLRERQVSIGKGHGEQFLGLDFENVANEWYATVTAPGTLADSTTTQWRIALDRHLIPVFGGSSLAQLIEPALFEDYVTAKLTNYAPKVGGPLPVGTTDPTQEPQPATPLAASTVAHHLAVLSMIFDWAVARNKVERNPIKAVNRKHLHAADLGQVEPFEREEVEALLKHTKKDEDKFFILTLGRLGLRIGEGFALKVSAYNTKNKTLRVGPTVKRRKNGAQYLETRRNRKKGKTVAAERTLQLSDDYAAQLDKHIAKMRSEKRIPAEGQGDGFIFPNNKGAMRHVGNWRNRVWNKVVVAAGLHDDSPDSEDGRPTPHKLRHTYASEQISNRVELNNLCYRMGHASPQTTLTIYTHIFKRHQQDVADQAGLYQMPIDDEPADSPLVIGE